MIQTRTLAALIVLLVGSTLHAQEHRPKLPKRPKHPHGLGALPELHDLSTATTTAPTGGAQVAAAAAAIDLSPNCPPIFNQGGFGSCVSCSTGYCLKGYAEKIEHGWDATQSSHQFSPAYLYNQVNGGRDGGSYVSDNFNVMVWRGISTLDVQPYGADVTSWPTQAQCAEAATFRNGLVGGSSYAVLANSNLSGIKSTIAAGTPCDICLYVDSAWDYISSATNYVWYPNGQNIRGGHCVALIGYDDNANDNNGHIGAFKVQNSWGTGWAQGGYIWISYAALSTSGVQSGICYGADRIGDTSSIQANVQVSHPARGQVRIDVGVGSTSSPTWSYSFYPYLSIGEDSTYPNVNTTLDLSDAAAYWPPSSTQKWWVRITDDSKDGKTGTLTQFTLVKSGTTLTPSSTLPLSVPDGGSVYAYIDNTTPTLTKIAVSPVSQTVVINTTQQFTATALDQNNNPFSPQPTITWSVSGGGGIDGNGLFTAGGTAGGPFSVTASGGGLTGTASITVVTQLATPTVHVSGITMSTAGNKRSFNAKATVTVLNYTGVAVSGATVTGTWSGVVSGTASGMTSTSGSATLSSPKTSTSGTFTFTVTGISAAGYSYDSASNTITSKAITK